VARNKGNRHFSLLYLLSLTFLVAHCHDFSVLNIAFNILTSAGLEIQHRGIDNSQQRHCKYNLPPLWLAALFGMAKVLPLIVRDKAQSVEEYRAKRRFKQGGQK
jgi:hypothetical protein